MGSSGETNIKGIDSSVGGLVWVRRRFGSWWPGRIIGLDELPEGSLVSPKSGTPVKLLGREDATVEWYNLEKSKRVKAVHRGEYNEWIEKAKASMSNSSRKAVKYARREIAIIHALEIESARLGKDHPDYFCRKDDSGGDEGGLARDSLRDVTDETSESEVDADSALGISQSEVEEPNHINGTKGHPMLVKRRKTPNDSEDDGKERIKRMRGLEDLGVGVGSKGKAQVVGLLKLVQQDNCMSNGGSVNGIGNHSSSLKRKRTQVTNVHEFLKRKYRRRQLTKVLESTAVVSVPVVCDELRSSNGSPVRGLSDSKVLGTDSNESRKSVSTIINKYNNKNGELDSTGVSCENGFSLNVSEHAVDPDASRITNKSKDNEISSVHGLAENSSSDRLFDVPFVGEDKPSADFSPIFVSCSTEMLEVDHLGRQAEIEGHNVPSWTWIGSVDLHTTCISQSIEKGTAEWQLKGKRNSRQTSKNRKQDSRRYVHMDDEHLDGFSQGSDRKVDCNGAGGSVVPYTCSLKSESELVVDDKLNGFQDWKSMSWEPCASPRRSLAHCQSRHAVQSRYQMTDFSGKACFADSSLYDVKIEVKADYRPQHVPLVSLVSKLNRKATIGHPLKVEVRSDDHHGNSTREPAVECIEVGHLVKRNPGGERVPRKHKISRSRRSLKAKKSRLLSKKTRRLSSFSGQKLGVAEWKPVAQKSESSIITCVPLELVFSRITEALNGSVRHIHRRSTSGKS